jgi:hypothetical protein
MPLGTTNISLSRIRDETGALVGTNDSFYDYNAFSWAQGPSPGDNSNSFWGAGTKTGVSGDILYNPSFNGAGTGIGSNFQFRLYKNYSGYMDQSNYIIETYVENNIPPASRPDPPNNVDIDAALRSEDLTSDVICPLGANGVLENGGTFGPGDQSQPTTFNVNYFYINGNYANQGFNPYNIDIYVNSGLEYSASVPGMAGPQAFDYTQFNTPNVVNNGNGFVFEVYLF